MLGPLDILILVWLAKKLGQRIREKGREPGWYPFWLVVFWFAGEFMGAVIGNGVVFSSERRFEPTDLLLIYPLAVAGAALMASEIFRTANKLSDLRIKGFQVQDYFEKNIDRGLGPEKSYRPVADEYRPK